MCQKYSSNRKFSDSQEEAHYTRIRFLSESIFATSYELLGALQIFNEGRELVLLEQAHKPVDHLPLLDRNNSGHSIDIVLHGKLGQVVDVDNGKIDSALLSGDGGVKARCEHLARTAPLGREVDHHWNLAGKHPCLEVIFVLDRVGCSPFGSCGKTSSPSPRHACNHPTAQHSPLL